MKLISSNGYPVIHLSMSLLNMIDTDVIPFD